MPKKARELSAIEVKRLTQPGLHFVGEVPGLALQVLPTGGRTWVLRTMVGTKRRDMGLGGYPEVSLADARNMAREARKKIKDGVDPIAEKREAKSRLIAASAESITFEAAAERFITGKSKGWTNDKHVGQWRSTLEQYAFPFIGNMNVAHIRKVHILNILEQPTEGNQKFIEAKRETADRVRGRIESIMRWCKARGHFKGDNPAEWKGNLEDALMEYGQKPNAKHHPAVQLKDAGAFTAEIRSKRGVSARALELLLLTAVRSRNIREATWDEFDLDAGMWVIPAAKMKMKREHRVPLSAAAIDLLKKLPRFENQALVFPAPRGGALTDMALNQMMRGMEYFDKDGRKSVPHGLRSTFRDWAGEMTNYPGDMAEIALAHEQRDEVEAAYRRGDMVEKRRRMMDDWAEFCATPMARTGVVVGIGSKRTA